MFLYLKMNTVTTQKNIFHLIDKALRRPKRMPLDFTGWQRVFTNF